MNKDKLFLLDGNSFCYRAYYAIRGLSTSAGRPTNAIYGFVNMLRGIIEEEHPRYLAVAFDMKGPTFRHRMFDGYKIKRRPMPEDLAEQMPVIKEIIGAYNISIFEKEGYEADDILATLVNQLKRPDLDIRIVTGDKDALQLVDEGVCVYNPYHKEAIIYDRQAVQDKFGVEPEFIPELLALIGDATDNIPGIKGIGEKTARDLLQQFKSLDMLLARLEEVKKEDLRGKIKENAQEIRLNRELVVLDKNVPIEFNLEDLRIKPPQKERLAVLFKELEFRNLLKDLVRDENAPVVLDFEEINTRKEFEALADRIKQRKEFVFVAEPMPTNSSEEGILLCIYQGEERPFIVRIGCSNSGITPQDLALLLEDNACLKICYDLKHSRFILDKKNIAIGKKIFDIMLAAYLVNPSAPGFGLADISLDYLGRLPEEAFGRTDETIGKSVKSAQLISGLFPILFRKLKERELLDLYENVEMPLADVLFSMEKRGVYLDLDFLRKISEELNSKITALREDIFETAGRAFNLDSPKQMREVLFTDLKLPVIKRGKTGPSTDEEVLMKLSRTHKLPKMLLEYRELAKLKSTYVDSLPRLINPRTKRIHTTFNQAGTETGRLSSSNPNLQNIPVKSDFTRRIRKAISSPGKDILLLSADYSQIELRILAHLSEDSALISAFQDGLDIHRHSASLIFSLPQEKIDNAMRSIAKTVNFGIIYGMSPFGLAKELNIEIEEAEGFIKSYFDRYPRVKSYVEDKIKEARLRGYVTTILNRRRYIPEINNPHQGIRQFAERIAVNTPVQGSAADIIKLAMLNIHRRIISEGIDAHLILQIHDELLFEFSRDCLDVLVKIVSNEMENVVKLCVPLKVSLKTGYNWLEMESV